TPVKATPADGGFLSNRRAGNGRVVSVPGNAGMFPGFQPPKPAPAPPPADTTPPRVVGAASAGNTTALISFSEAMSDSALNAGNYSIMQTNVNPEAGTLRVLSASFHGGDRTTVQLTTSSQNELSYTVTAF